RPGPAVLGGRRPGEHGARRGDARSRGERRAGLLAPLWLVRADLESRVLPADRRGPLGSSMAGPAGRAAGDRGWGHLAPPRADLRDRRAAELAARPPEYGAVSGRAWSDRRAPGGTGHPGPPTRRGGPDIPEQFRTSPPLLYGTRSGGYRS